MVLTSLSSLSSDFDLMELDHVTVSGVSQEIGRKQFEVSLSLVPPPTPNCSCLKTTTRYTQFRCKWKPVMQKKEIVFFPVFLFT